MAKTAPVPTKTVRNASTGRFVTVRGVGALKGTLALKQGVDLTKPIYPQAAKTGAAPKKKH